MGTLVLAPTWHFGSHAASGRAWEPFIAIHWHEVEPHTTLSIYISSLTERWFPHMLFSLYGCTCLLPLMYCWVLLLFDYISYFFCSHAWPLYLFITFLTFCDPFEGDYCYEWTRICYPLPISLDFLCSKHGTLSHSTRSLQTSSLFLSSWSLNHEGVILLVNFYLFLRLCGLFKKKKLCRVYY